MTNGLKLIIILFLIVAHFDCYSSQEERNISDIILANPNKWGFITKIYCRGIKEFICMGTLIHPRWVLTAGFCVQKSICYGKVLVNAYENPSFLVKKVNYGVLADNDIEIRHPKYEEIDGDLRRDDIGLIRLKMAVNLTQGVRVVKLSLGKPIPEYRCVFAIYPFWKQKAKLHTIPTSKFEPCDEINHIYEKYGKKPVTNLCNYAGITFEEDQRFLTGPGGPLICGGYQFGIFSNIKEDGLRTKIIWMFLAGYYGWIFETLRSHGDNITISKGLKKKYRTAKQIDTYMPFDESLIKASVASKDSTMTRCLYVFFSIQATNFFNSI